MHLSPHSQISWLSNILRNAYSKFKTVSRFFNTQHIFFQKTLAMCYFNMLDNPLTLQVSTMSTQQIELS